ncbi:MAG: septation protein A [Duodenibacillus sp.]|nr:septation protein A [Duodenibacillus sp.]
MKLLFDLFPVILFFGVFKYGEGHAEGLQSLMGGLLAGAAPAQAPVIAATAAAVAASVLQVAWVLARGRRPEPALWVSLAVILVFGSLTVWLQNELFIKWKPTILYGIFAGTLGWAHLTGRNFIERLMGRQIELAPAQWARLQLAWCGFFAFLGALNLAVAYAMSTAAWVNFKLFGLFGLTMLFTFATVFWMMKSGGAPGRSGDA